MPGTRKGGYIVKSDLRTTEGRETASKLQYNKNTYSTQSTWNVKGGESRKKSVCLRGLQEKVSSGKRWIPTKERTQSNFSKGK